MNPMDLPTLQNNSMKLRTASSPSNTIESSWAYPALREWAKHLKTPNEAIDRMIIMARKESAPMYAVKKQPNGKWSTLSFNTPQDVEAFFKAHHPRMLQLARKG